MQILRKRPGARAACLAVLLVGLALALRAQSPAIRVWYGLEQEFGGRGLPQPWYNILGSIDYADRIGSFTYSLNGGAEWGVSLGQDDRRLARPGDFNIELARRELLPGINNVRLRLIDLNGRESIETVRVLCRDEGKWPLPYRVKWSEAKNITDAVQVVDGLWNLTPQGARTVEPYYDRVLAIGDMSWTDFEATVVVILHGFSGPSRRPPHYGVTHFGIGLRWRGHQEDGKQPRERWYPLGAAAELQLFPGLRNCRWRILGDNRKRAIADVTHSLELERPYMLKARVETTAEKGARYSVKVWDASGAEPSAWAVSTAEGPDDFQSGSLLLVAHNSDVTFGDLEVQPLAH